jgi:tetratricopeptide (TPR) repeat protein
MADLGDALGATGDYARARAVLHAPLAAAREVGFLPGIGESLTALALLEWRAHDDRMAEQYAQEALVIATTIDDNETAAYCLAVLAFVAARQGEREESRACYYSSLEHARRAGDPRGTALALEGLAQLALATDPRAAARMLGAAAAFRQLPGRATGTAFAVGAGTDGQEMLAAARRDAGAAVVARSFADGAADPERVVAEVSP